MQLLLDPADLWLGRPGRFLRAGDRKPVALPDALTVTRDSAPVSIAALDNDFDVEGPVTLVSAFAALGTATAEADGTVSYTPPPGFTGADSIVYEIADTADQRDTGQIDIAVVAPTLVLETTPVSTFVVTAEPAPAGIEVTEPAVFAGTYSVDLGDLSGGPVNLVPPAVSGTPATGGTLSASPGLWIRDEAADPAARAWQWRRDGADIAGATASDYVVAAADAGTSLTAAETLTDSAGARSALSAPLPVGGGAFTPADDPQVIAWWDAADAATLTASGSGLSAWADLVSGVVLAPPGGAQTPSTGQRLLNGLNVIDFDGGDHLEATLALPASGDVAFHAALIVDAVTNQYAALLAVDAANDFQIDAAAASQFDGRLSAAGIGTTTPLTGGPFSGALIVSAVFDRSGAAAAEIFVAGAARGTMAYTAPIDATVALHLMTNRSKNASIDGAVAELVVTGDVQNRGAHHGYLSAKWGIA